MSYSNKFFSAVLAVVLMSGFSISKDVCAAPIEVTGPVHGTTGVTIPGIIYNLRLDNYGKISGSGSAVTVSHADSGLFCAKVASVSVLLSGFDQNFTYPNPYTKNLNLCSFNPNDAAFNFEVSGISSASFSSSLQEKCRMSDTNTFVVRPFLFFKDYLQVALRYNNGDIYIEKHPAPSISLTCDPCPPKSIILQSPIKMYENKPVSIPLSSIVTGGMLPYKVVFSGLPAGLYYQDGVLSGKPLKRGNYKGLVQVNDNCKSGDKGAWKNIDFYVYDSSPPKIMSAFATPAFIDWRGGYVQLETRVIDNNGVGFVEAVIKGPGSDKKNITLSRSVGSAWDGLWKGQFIASPNMTSQDISYSVSYKASDTDGNQAVEDNTTLALFVVPGDKILPKIVSFAAAPGTLPSEGGAVTVSVNASDNAGVQSVTMYLTKPDGSRSTQRLAQSAGNSQNGEWKTTWQMPGNTGNKQQTYWIQVAVYDLAGNIVNSKDATVLVQPRGRTQIPVIPGKPAMPTVPMIKR